MPNYSMKDAEYWKVPERLETFVETAAQKIPNARFTTFALGDPDVDTTPAAVIFQMDPGYVVTRHAHVCDRVEVVVLGSIDVGDRILYPGDVMTAGPREAYGPKVAGPDGCTTVEIFSRMDGQYRRLTEGDDEQLMESNLLEHPELLEKVAQEEREHREAAKSAAFGR